MPKYLAPGIYIEETGHRAAAIAGVPTSTTGFVGAARSGPVSGPPVLITSDEEFQRNFGDAADLKFAGVPTTNHLARAVGLFFQNGGLRVYVARVFRTAGKPLSDFTAASAALPTSAGNVRIAARFPGRAGNLAVRIQAQRSRNLIVNDGDGPSLIGVRPGDVVEIGTAIKEQRVKSALAPASAPGEALTAELASVSFDAANRPILNASSGPIPLSQITAAQKITFTIIVEDSADGSPAARADQFPGLSAHPDSDQFVGNVLGCAFSDNMQRVCFQLPALPPSAQARAAFAGSLLHALVNTPLTLTGGSDGDILEAPDYAGRGSGSTASGLAALAEIADIAIVAAPGSAALGTAKQRSEVRSALIAHCEQLKYRFAVLAAPYNADVAAIRMERSGHDSKYAAFYHPWLIVADPAPTAPDKTVALSPEGAICGIYARCDTSRGVHKAPANEVVRGVLRLSAPISKGIQDVLNPEGINCLRNLQGRGNLVWGARTISSDPEWKYINVRRLFIFLEHSIVRGTQWAVFEPNNEQLWARIRLMIENFLLETWRNGGLMGAKPEEGFFVRCDRTTMSQEDLDNGRLVCLIGVAPLKPAEFMIFRIGQWTADASIV